MLQKCFLSVPCMLKVLPKSISKTGLEKNYEKDKTNSWRIAKIWQYFNNAWDNTLCKWQKNYNKGPWCAIYGQNPETILHHGGKIWKLARRRKYNLVREKFFSYTWSIHGPERGGGGVVAINFLIWLSSILRMVAWLML